LSSRCSNFSLSPSANLDTGILVHLDIMAAMLSSSTVSDNISDLLISSREASSFSSLGIV